MLDTPDSKKKKAERLIELDSLRGIACISVMLFHYTYYYDNNWKHSQEPLVLFENGRYGVELFFLISGFVRVAVRSPIAVGWVDASFYSFAKKTTNMTEAEFYEMYSFS